MTAANHVTEKTGKKPGLFRTLQAQLVRRRIWLLAAVTLYMVLYYPVGVVMLISRANAQAAATGYGRLGYGPEKVLASRLGEVSTWIGIRQPFSFVFVLMGFVLAITGYDYLFSMEKQDFYDAQPVSKRSRFWNIYINGFLIFLVPLALCLVLSIAFAAGMETMNALMFGEAMLELLRNILLFAASYSIGILAVMLTGNPVICTLVSAFFMGIDVVLFYLVRGLMEKYFATWCYYQPVGERLPAALFSPLYNSTTINSILAYNSDQLRYGPVTNEMLSHFLHAVWAGDLVNLIVGAAVMLIAWRLFTVRKEEYVGCTVIYKPVSGVIRISVSVAAGLLIYLLIQGLFDSGTEGSMTAQAFSVIGMAVGVVLAAGICRIIHELNFWKFFGRPGEMSAAVALAAILLCSVQADFFGYDRYVPSEDDVASAALYVYSDTDSGYINEMDPSQGISAMEHAFQKMTLTDIGAVREIVSAGMELQKEAVKLQDTVPVSDEAYYEEGWSASVCWRLKSGRKVYRSIMIPCDTDPALLNRVTGSTAYHQGAFSVYDDSYAADVSDTDPGSVYLTYSNGFITAGPDSSAMDGRRKANGSLYREFADAYRKDLQKYNYSMASTEDCIGMVMLEINNDSYYTNSYTVYPSYSNTIRFLKEHDLYLAPPTAEDFARISIDYYDDDSSAYVSADYTDKTRMEEILSSCVKTLSTDWKQSSLLDQDYEVTASDVSGEYAFYSLVFRKDDVPAFVEEDIQAALDQVLKEAEQN